MRRLLFLFLIGAFALAAACGGDEDGGDSQGADTPIVSQATGTSVIETTDEADERVELDAAVSGDDVPDDVDGPDPGAEQRIADLVFEERTFASLLSPGDASTQAGSVTVAIPVGWEEDPVFKGEFRPRSDRWGALFHVGSTCGRDCDQKTARELAAIADRYELQPFREDGRFTIVRDIDLADGKLLHGNVRSQIMMYI